MESIMQNLSLTKPERVIDELEVLMHEWGFTNL
jgi:hypothetical protein